MGTEVALSELLEVLIDHRGRTPRKLGSNFVSKGVQVISAQNIVTGRLDLGATSRFVTSEVADRWMPRPLRPGDVLLSSEAPMGRVARVPHEAPRLCVGQRLFALRPKASVADSRYFAAALRSSWVQAQLAGRLSGTTAQGIRQSELRQVWVRLPCLAEQRAIADVLDALDDKIESNERLVARLTEVARLVYERAVIGAPLGTLGDLGTVVGGGTPRSAVPEFWSPEEVPWITPSDMTALSGRPVIWSGDRAISQPGLAGSSAQLLPFGTVVFTSRATIGLVAIARQELATNQGFISVVPRPPISSEFVYSSLVARTEAIRAKANGSTFLEVNKTNFKAVECPLPADDRLAEHDVVASPNIALAASLVLESRRLAAIRDVLLPRLVSGRTRVPLTNDLDEAVEAVLDAA